MESNPFYLLLLLISLLANTLSAFAGGGAGLVQFPALILLGLPFGIALATHKVATVALGIGSAFRYSKEGLVNTKLAFIVLIFGLPGVALGAIFILRVNEAIATLLLGLLTLVLGIYSMTKKSLGKHYQPKNHNMAGLIKGGLVIFFIGIANGSLTSGTGLFATLWFIYWFGLDYKRAVALTMILVGLFWNGTGAITLSVIGEVRWDWLIPLLLGSLAGGYLGANIAITKGNVFIKRSFECITLLMGLSLTAKVVFACHITNTCSYG